MTAQAPSSSTMRIAEIREYGQSAWLDSISRGLIASEDLRRLVTEDGLAAITSNPSNDTEGTVAEARRLLAEVNRPDLMIKVSGTADLGFRRRCRRAPCF
jgi:transaldolase